MNTIHTALEAVLNVMKFDGAIPLSNPGPSIVKFGTDGCPETRNLCYKISEEDNLELWFASIDTDATNIEAFIVADKQGNFSFFDHSSNGLVINNHVVYEYFNNPDLIEDVLNEYRIDGAGPKDPPKPGHIKALMDVLNQMGR